MIPALDVRDAITVLTAVVTITGVILAQRAGISKLTDGQAELLRQIGAVHKRLDHYGTEITRIDKDHVRLDERVKALKESQRFKLSQTKQDMFAAEDEE